MKKALSFAVALGLVAGAASVASAAELAVTGDARLRGVYHSNFDMNDAAQDKDQRMDHRYRLKVDVKVNDDVTVQTRLVMGDNNFGMATANNVTADRYNMVIKTLGGTWTLGRQEASWANAPLPYLAKDVTVDRIKGVYKAGDITFGGYLQKNSENTLGMTNGDGDSDTWGALVIAKAGDATFGLLANYNILDTQAAKDSDKTTGYMLDPYFIAKAGPATVLGELLYQSGDTGKHLDKSKLGGYVAAVVGMDPVTLTALAAYSKNCSTASSKFAPSVLIGTDQATAMIDFGGTDDATQNNDRSYLLAGVVSFKASDKVTVAAAVGYLGATKYGVGGEKGSLTEVDVTAEFALAQNAKYKIGVGYGDPKKLAATEDNIIAIGNSVEVSW